MTASLRGSALALFALALTLTLSWPVAKSAPDGYTLLAMSNTHTTNESLTPNKPFQLMRDFVPVAGINYSDLVMVIHPSVPAKDLKEFIAYAKSKPGELNYASSGAGTP